MPKTYACFASGGEHDPDIAIWFTPENHKALLGRAHAAAQLLCKGPDGAFSISYVRQPDAACESSALEEQLEAVAPEDHAAQANYCEWFADPPAPPADDDRHVRIDFSKLVCDDKHFWFVVRNKYSDVEYQTDYFAWADLPEGIL